MIYLVCTFFLIVINITYTKPNNHLQCVIETKKESKSPILLYNMAIASFIQAQQ